MYTHMKYTMDIYNNTLLCDGCERKTMKVNVVREGLQLRAWQCPDCKKIWYHPADQLEYDNFRRLKTQTFHVKLRLVGNSYTVSIPREIIDFEEEMQKEMQDMIRMVMDEPHKLSLFFTNQKVRKVY